jgi:hypothetical protein
MIRYPSLQGLRDANEAGIVAALEMAGATVEKIPTGRGVPDLLVGFKDVNYLLEVKIKTGKLNAKQVKWHSNWAGTVYVVRTPREALIAIGAIKPDFVEKVRSNGL